MPQTLRSRTEFTVLIAMLFATVALSIDAMLPALPEIAATMSPGAPNRAQLVVTSFVLGMGIGTLFAGPMSDRFGRRRVLLAGGALYALAALACWAAPSLEMLLIARVIQGIGAAGPRTVTLAIVRDLYSGREMAKIVSVAMSIFSLVPAVAPLMGQAVMGFACAAVDGGITMPSAAALPWIAVLGGTGLGAHFCVTSALRLAPATVVMPFDFLRLPVIAIVGLVLYGEPIGVAVVIGAALIVMGNFVNLRAKPATT